MPMLPKPPTELAAAFHQRYPAAGRPVAAFAPGRVNLIGDHIDYCGGIVLPMPIQHGTWVLAAANETGQVRAHSDTAVPELCFRWRATPTFEPGHWGRFVAGAAAVLGAGSGPPCGVDLLVHGTIPGNGLSSSASLSVALLLAIGSAIGRPITGMPLALAAQRIEHEHIGVACGLMDQAAIVLGQAGAALAFDCAARQGTAVPLPADQCAIVVADSGVPRSLAGSAYNERRRSLERVAAMLGLNFTTLAATLPLDIALADPVLARRARHVASEQQRVRQAVDAAAKGDWQRFGRLLDDSHASLRDDYQVSCPELDTLADALRCQPGCFGARLTGAGFGGAVVAAVAPQAADACRRAAAAAYRSRTGKTAATFIAHSTGGARCHG